MRLLASRLNQNRGQMSAQLRANGSPPTKKINNLATQIKAACNVWRDGLPRGCIGGGRELLRLLRCLISLEFCHVVLASGRSQEPLFAPLIFPPTGIAVVASLAVCCCFPPKATTTSFFPHRGARSRTRTLAPPPSPQVHRSLSL